MTTAVFGTVQAILTIGSLIGALAVGPISSKRGRNAAMITTAVFYFVGSLLETVAWNAYIMAAGRFLSGVGCGASTVVVPIYVNEIAPPKQRGLFGYMTQISINIGILFAQSLGYFKIQSTAKGQWRWILAAGVIIAVVQFVGLLIAPESPSWLAAHGKTAQGKRNLQRIRGKNFNIKEETQAWEEHEGIASEEDRLLAEPEATSPLLDTGKNALQVGHVLLDPFYRPAVIAVIGVAFAQQLCGINSIVVYSVSLLDGLLPTDSALISVIVSVINLVATVACSVLPDRLGRKGCLLLSIVGQGISSLALALSIMCGLKILSAVSVFLFVGFFAVGLGPVPFLLSSELVGTEAVDATQGLCLAANYIATFLVIQIFPIINEALNNLKKGNGTVFFLFAGLAAFSFVFVAWRVPETKGKKDADEVWGRYQRLD